MSIRSDKNGGTDNTDGRIIRAITLVNKNITDWRLSEREFGKVEENFPYISFGYHDLVKISPDLNKKNRADDLRTEDDAPLTKLIWDKELESSGDLTGKNTRENVYILRDESDDVTKKDEEFWDHLKKKGGETGVPDDSKTDDLPFIFITFMRTNRLTRGINWLREIVEREAEKICEKINGNARALRLDKIDNNKDVIKCITYLTLDTADIIFITRARRYEYCQLVHEALSKMPFNDIRCKKHDKKISEVLNERNWEEYKKRIKDYSSNKKKILDPDNFFETVKKIQESKFSPDLMSPGDSTFEAKCKSFFKENPQYKEIEPIILDTLVEELLPPELYQPEVYLKNKFHSSKLRGIHIRASLIFGHCKLRGIRPITKNEALSPSDIYQESPQESNDSPNNIRLGMEYTVTGFNHGVLHKDIKSSDRTAFNDVFDLEIDKLQLRVVVTEGAVNTLEQNFVDFYKAHRNEKYAYHDIDTNEKKEERLYFKYKKDAQGNEIKDEKNVNSLDRFFRIYDIKGNDDFIIELSHITWRMALCMYDSGNELLNVGMSKPGFHPQNQENRHENRIDRIAYVTSFILSPLSLDSEQKVQWQQSGDDNSENADKIKEGLKKISGEIAYIVNNGINCTYGCDENKESCAYYKKLEGTNCRSFCNAARTAFQDHLARMQKHHLDYDYANGFSATFYRAFIHLLNSLEKFERQGDDLLSPPYGYMLIMNSVISLVKNIILGDADTTGEVCSTYLDFVRKMSSTVQSALRADREYFTSPEVNIAVSDVPIKLTVAHASFMTELSLFLRMLGKTELPGIYRSYAYMFYPSVEMPASQVITDGHKMEEYRIHLIKINTKYTFDPQMLLFTLAHEVAHSAGRELRNRRYRLDCVIEIIITAVFNELYDSLLDEIKREIRDNAPKKKYKSTQNDIDRLKDFDVRKEILDGEIKKCTAKVIAARKRLAEEQYPIDDIPSGTGEQFYRYNAQNDVVMALRQVFVRREIKEQPDFYRTPYDILFFSVEDFLKGSSQPPKYEKGVKSLDIKNKETLEEMLDGLLHIGIDAVERLYSVQLITNYVGRDPREKTAKPIEPRSQWFSFVNIAEQSFDLLDEVYADVVSIRTLNISPAQYYTNITDAIYNSGTLANPFSGELLRVLCSCRGIVKFIEKNNSTAKAEKCARKSNEERWGIDEWHQKCWENMEDDKYKKYGTYRADNVGDGDDGKTEVTAYYFYELKDANKWLDDLSERTQKLKNGDTLAACAKNELKENERFSKKFRRKYKTQFNPLFCYPKVIDVAVGFVDKVLSDYEKYDKKLRGDNGKYKLDDTTLRWKKIEYNYNSKHYPFHDGDYREFIMNIFDALCQKNHLNLYTYMDRIYELNYDLAKRIDDRMERFFENWVNGENTVGKFYYDKKEKNETAIHKEGMINGRINYPPQNND